MHFRGPEARDDTWASPEQALVRNRTSRNRLGSPLPFRGEFELAIMIAGATEEMHGSDRGS